MSQNRAKIDKRSTRLATEDRSADALPSRRLLRHVMVTALVVFQIVTVTSILISQYVNGQRALRSHMQQTMAGVIDEIRENAIGFLTPAQHAAELAQRLFDGNLLAWERPRQLEHYFIEQLRVIQQLDGVFYADREGRFVMAKRQRDNARDSYLIKTIDITDGARKVMNRWYNEALEETRRSEDPTDQYDPRTRPWYKKAVAQKEVIWTDPYVFFTSRQPGVTTAIPVFEGNGRVQGVVGVDIELGELSRFLAQQHLGRRGSAFIINRQGEYVTHSDISRILRQTDAGGLRVARFEEMHDPVERASLNAFQSAGALLNFALLDLERTRVTSFDAKGSQYHAVFTAFSREHRWPWLIGAYAADEDFIGSIRSSERTKLILAIVISAAITLFAFLLARRFTRPVVALRDELDRDALTGIRNRRSLFEIAPRLVNEARRYQSPVSLIMIDLDQFKTINDTHGHIVGDEVLIAVVNRLKGAVSKDDLLARYAGDEFILVLPGMELAVAGRVGERLRVTVGGMPVKTSAGNIAVTVSVGVADLCEEAGEFEQVLDQADRAMRSAKVAGRNRVMVVSELSSQQSEVRIAPVAS